MLMPIKKVLRQFGCDVVKYRDFWKTVVRPRGIKTLLDVGANKGLFARDFRAHFPDVFIHSFEPLPSVFSELEKIMAEDAHFRAWQIALGAETKDVVMHQSSFHPSSSLLRMAALHKKLYPKSAEHTEIAVQVERMDDVLAEEKLDRPIMMKLDVQGYEADALRGATKTLTQTSIILCETSFVPLYENQPLFGDIHDLLRAHDFSYHGSYERHFDPITHTPIYEDSVFLKNA